MHPSVATQYPQWRPDRCVAVTDATGPKRAPWEPLLRRSRHYIPAGALVWYVFVADQGAGKLDRAYRAFVMEAMMTNVKWMIKAREFVNCNCAYGCPCQFNALPTHGNCEAVAGMEIDQGYHGDTRLDGLRFVGIFRWPGAIHEGKGEAAVVIDERASEAQRGALLRILSGQDTEPGATIFQVFSTTFEKMHEPIFAAIDFDVDIDARKGRLMVRGVTEGRGEPIKNPITGAEYRVRIDIPDGFEYSLAEMGRGWNTVTHPMSFKLADSYAQFAHVNLCQSGIVK